MPRSPHKAGVYAIEQIGTGRLYIGSSMDIPRRWFAHKSELSLGRHHSPKLQNAWSKYGTAAFQWIVLEVCPQDVTKEQLLAREQSHIDSRRPWFNILPTAGSRYGSQDEEITRQRKSAARRSVTDLITHCPRGHEYTPSNTHLTKRNQRICLECARIRVTSKYVPKTVRRNGPTCKRGHEWTPENTRILDNGTRQCIACADERAKARYERAQSAEAREKSRAQKRADFQKHREARLADSHARDKARRQKHIEERIARGEKPGTLATCRKGHPWTPENTLQWKDKRLCRTCHDAARAMTPEQHAAHLAQRRDRERATWHDANQRAYQRRLAKV